MNSNPRLRPCPACDKPISKRARQCPHCQHVLPENMWRMKIKPWFVPAMVLFVVVGLIFVAFGIFRSVESPEKGLPGLASAAGNWPTWRGPGYNNTAVGDAPPVTWDEKKNIIWKTEVPGRGHATPVVWGDRIFLPTADEEQQVLSLVCVHSETGSLIWNTEIHRGGLMNKSKKNSYASSTVACDGQRIFVPFIVDGGLWLTATDLDGRILWQTRVTSFQSEHGYGSSPLVYKSLVILAGDHLEKSFLTGLDVATGEIVWQTPRKRGGSYGSPVMARLANSEQLLLSGQGEVTSYNPLNGQPVWRSRANARSTVGTIAWYEPFVFASTLNGTICIRADGKGNVSRSHVVWENRVKANVPSPLIVDDRILVVDDEGFVTCLAISTGRQLWKKRLGGNVSASPVLAAGHVYLPLEDGQLFVFKAGEKFELVSKNDLGDGGFASPVICEGQIFLRTDHYLYCIGHG